MDGYMGMNRIATGREYERCMARKNGAWNNPTAKKSFGGAILKTVEYVKNGVTRYKVYRATKGWRDYNPKFH